MWDDVVQDPCGNVMINKPAGAGGDADGDNNWEIVSSNSLKERRKLQVETDWPLSARAQQEKEQIKERNKNRDNKKEQY